MKSDAMTKKTIGRWVLGAIGAFALVGCGNLEDQGLDTSADDILNGTVVTRNDTGVVAIYAGGSFLCSGTYMGGKWVVTARHCVEATSGVPSPLRAASTLWVTALLNPGPTKPSSVPSGSSSSVASVSVYAGSTTVDVAMLKLGSALSATYTSPPAGLAGSRTVGEQLLCEGYGRNTTASTTDTGVGVLRKAFLTVTGVGIHSPNETVSRTDWPHQIQLARNSSLQSTYYGDSGGPCFKSFGSPGGGGVALATVHRTGYPLANPTSDYDVSVANNTPWYSWMTMNLQTP